MTENEVLEPPFPGPCQAGPEPVARGRFRDLSHVSECMRHRRAISPEMPAKNAPVAQLDRALDYESRGQEFESLRARQIATIPNKTANRTPAGMRSVFASFQCRAQSVVSRKSMFVAS